MQHELSQSVLDKPLLQDDRLNVKLSCICSFAFGLFVCFHSSALVHASQVLAPIG